MKETELINQCAEVAGYLWQKGWAERNGGNLVMRFDADVDNSIRNLPPLSLPLPCNVSVPFLKGRYLYCKGSGKRMRDLAKNPMDNGSIIRVLPDGEHYEIVACLPIQPTSEIASHLAIHNYLVSIGSPNKATLHTHPTSLVAMSHIDNLLDGTKMTQLLWSMIPEARLFCEQGIGIVRYAEPGSTNLANATLHTLRNHDIVLWEKHGTFTIGTNMIEAFDTTDVMEKAADIYIKLRSIQPEDKQL